MHFFRKNFISFYIKKIGGGAVIELGAFYGCIKLTNVTIPANIEEVGYGIFADCTGLESVTYNSKAYISDCMFEGCTSLKSVSLCNGVSGIGKGAFSNCIKLSSITVTPGLIGLPV